jgi:hypothetical protein
MARHTPNPWKISAPWSGFSKISGPNGELIFGLAAGSTDEKRSDEECEANARLIEAAPDLLAACVTLEAAEDANANCRECDGQGVPELCPVCFPLFDDARLKRRAAIAKATAP